MDCTPVEAQCQLGTVGLLASSPVWGVLVVTRVLLGQAGLAKPWCLGSGAGAGRSI